MRNTLFRPTWPQALLLGTLAATAIGYAYYVRFLAIEASAVSLACDAGRSSALCTSRTLALAFSQSSAFGGIALGAAVLNLIRPSIVLCTLASVSAGFGLVLYNTATSALAIAVLILSLARPAPEPE